MDTGYSLSDIASVANDGAFGGGNSAWVLILLFLVIFGFGGNGFGRNTESAIANNEILSGQKFDALSRQINQVGDGLCSSTYALNNAIVNEGRTLGSAINNGFSNLQNCCCDLKYDMATQFANVNATTTAQTQKILDALAQNKIESLQAEVNTLKTQNMFCGVPRISPYMYNITPNCGCANI